MTKQVRNLKYGDVALGKTVDYVYTQDGSTEIHFVSGSMLRLPACTRLPKKAQ